MQPVNLPQNYPFNFLVTIQVRVAAVTDTLISIGYRKQNKRTNSDAVAAVFTPPLLIRNLSITMQQYHKKKLQQILV